MRALIHMLLTLGLLLPVTFARANGGVITGGGGGVINPDPVELATIEESVHNYARFILTSWFRRVQFESQSMSDDQRRKSPFAKLFGVKVNIFTLIDSYGVEVRYSRPCFDSGGGMSDASIYAEKPTSVCLSAFRIAPKLSFYNVDVEALALVAHEFSHLLGTNEPEARAIQQQFVYDFARTNFEERASDVRAAMQILGSPDGAPSSIMHSFLERVAKRDPSALIAENLIPVKREIELATGSFRSKDNRLWYLPVESMLRLRPRLAGFTVAFDDLCANDASLSAGFRARCQAELDAGFAGGNSVTAREFYQNTTRDPFCAKFPASCYGVEFEKTRLKRPTSFGETWALIDRFLSYLIKTRSQMNQLFVTPMPTYKTE